MRTCACVEGGRQGPGRRRRRRCSGWLKEFWKRGGGGDSSLEERGLFCLSLPPPLPPPVRPAKFRIYGCRLLLFSLLPLCSAMRLSVLPPSLLPSFSGAKGGREGGRREEVRFVLGSQQKVSSSFLVWPLPPFPPGEKSTNIEASGAAGG